jgi:NAD(P)-dependent dehydrogenase (short-subunit alcohol dehydrogenase family)
MVQDFADKVAIVTGAASGVGAASAQTLAARGAAVVVADIDASGAERVAEAIRTAGGRAIASVVDVAEEAQVAAMVETARREFGGVDVLHNNAALLMPEVMGADGPLTEADPLLWERVLRVNLIGYMLGAKHVIPLMIARGGGVIINTASGTGLQGELLRPAYGTSKAAIMGFTRNVATQYGKQGIRCVALALGLVLTEGMKAALPAEAQAGFVRHQLTPTLAEPGDVAEIVAFLASGRAALITGTTIVADGGFSAHTPTYADELG